MGLARVCPVFHPTHFATSRERWKRRSRPSSAMRRSPRVPASAQRASAARARPLLGQPRQPDGSRAVRHRAVDPMMRRTIDILLAICGLVLLSPVLVAIAILVWVIRRKPALWRLARGSARPPVPDVEVSHHGERRRSPRAAITAARDAARDGGSRHAPSDQARRAPPALQFAPR